MATEPEDGTPAPLPVTVRGTTLGAGRPAVVVPLTGATVEALLAEVAAVLAVAEQVDLVEWRVDHLAAGLAPADVVAAGRAVTGALDAAPRRLPLLVTIRTTAEGGSADVDPPGYEAALRAAVDAGIADLLDVEVARDAATVDRVVARAHAAGVPVVGSHHDFDRTPPREQIAATLLAMADLGADVLKVAVMPHDPGDVLALLGATWDTTRRTGRPVITMAMGPLGVASRVAGGTFGSAATFAAVGAASAPGQVGLAALRAALDVVHPA
ncbi:type I 3-dehydroquinate dehydratase [Cellulomonas triticagri]|uniref:3-dehydroquinate dehydratase n=1 Tax=Cellulomonas triticagri TaxID=2483352 RepID=A0A3M2J558_9CELL|nr:type I 3-dehydroquinate dehydratase [Cellulomonas triticagri]RMI09232.1 type I 3-dehydroquinate dehydratase [Cellulomonas triticagri]